MATATAKATYAKLKDESWGIRVQGSVKAGDVVTVAKRDGSTKQETVAAVLWTGDGVSLCSIRKSDAPARKPYSPAAGRADGKVMTGRCWECGGAMPQWLADKGEECGRC